ncbi:MAG: Y-family DNA polymerase, partial [Roseiarcus sp.]
MTTRRFLSLWLPRLATDRARRLGGVDKAAPLVAVARIDNAQRLICVDAQAARLGLNTGLSLPDARARFPALIAVEAEPAEEARLLERLCDWCSRFTPLAALDCADGLMLDISGVAHLFEGEAALIEDCRARLASHGISVLIGAAGNPRAASALARFSRVKTAPEPLSDKALAKLFHDLPLAALGLDEKTVADMARAGLRRIGDIALRPRAPITARFGSVPMARLDALKGLERPSIAPRFAPPDFCAERQFASPIQTFQAIEAQLRKLADDLVVLLERQAKGARRIELNLYRVDGEVRRIRVGASRPLNEARAIVRLIAERLASPDEDVIDAGYGVDLMRLA